MSVKPQINKNVFLKKNVKQTQVQVTKPLLVMSDTVAAAAQKTPCRCKQRCPTTQMIGRIPRVIW